MVEKYKKGIINIRGCMVDEDSPPMVLQIMQS